MIVRTSWQYGNLELEDDDDDVGNLAMEPSMLGLRLGAECTTEGRKQNRNKLKSWKIGEIKYRQNITCWNCNHNGHFHYQCSKLVATRDKEVNIAARDSYDAFVCCVKNTVSGASLHATYCKEELERFKLYSGKTLKDVRYIPGLKRRLISVGQLDEEGYHAGFRDQQWKVTKGSLVVAYENKRGSLYMVEVHPEGIGVIIVGSGSVTLWFREVEEGFLHNVRKDKETTKAATGVTIVPTAVDKYLGTKLDDALLKILERHTTDLIEKYSVLPGLEFINNQESEKSPKEVIRIKREQGTFNWIHTRVDPAKRRDDSNLPLRESDTESEHSEQSTDDIPMQDEGHVSDLEDTDNAHIPKVSTTTVKLGQSSKGSAENREKNKLCKADLEGPTFNLVKAFHKNNVFLQYQMDECHKLLTNKVDLGNPEGHQILRNVYEPLPLGDQPGQLDHMLNTSNLYEYNKGMETRKWSEDDKRRSKDFITAIEKRLQIRRIYRSLESFVGGRIRDIDYRLINRTT
ncbi:retrovirus-related pol polyprotein from transposon TNT 1-94 [Tanacetum coccineum]